MYVNSPKAMRAIIVSVIHPLDIVRILLMVPLYAIISTASYLFWVRIS